MIEFNRLAPRLSAGAAVLFVLAACSEKPPPPPPQQAFEVGVFTVRPTSVPLVVELPGRTSPYLVAQVRARVDGIVTRREFREGADVRSGQRLYQIDPAPYRAALNGARAALARAEANLGSTTALASRYKALVAANAVSRQDYDNAVAAQDQAAADVAAGKAAVETASINLGYTDVVAPIGGRIGVSQVTQGAYVQGGAATLLATVQQIDPIYVDLTQSSLEGLRLRRAVETGRLSLHGPDQAKVSLTLEDGSVYPQTGALQFTDITVDAGTGSVTIRAIFPNPHHVLLPGMFVRARIEQGVEDAALLVPQVGITHDQKGQPTALVVGPENKVELRVLEANRTYADKWIVERGLAAGDRVIVAGLQKVQPGATVRVTEAGAAPAGKPASGAAPGGNPGQSPGTPPNPAPGARPGDAK